MDRIYKNIVIRVLFYFLIISYNLLRIYKCNMKTHLKFIGKLILILSIGSTKHISEVESIITFHRN